MERPERRFRVRGERAFTMGGYLMVSAGTGGTAREP
jgi:hypothetical protein